MCLLVVGFAWHVQGHGFSPQHQQGKGQKTKPKRNYFENMCLKLIPQPQDVCEFFNLSEKNWGLDSSFF